MRQPNRLPAEGDHRLKGSEIDRSRPIAFRLDGREIQGFAGDTLLSALLASGIIGAGTHEGDPLALDERFAPPVLLRGHAHDRLRALPLERTPAMAGLDLVTLASAMRGRFGHAASLARSLLPGRRGLLDLSYDHHASLTSPWFDAPSERELKADLVVIGGGLAGMAAAAAAAKRGSRVVLVERRQWLGGEVRFFGTGGDSQSPDDMVTRLATAVSPNVTVLHRAEAFALFEGMVRVNQVTVEDGVPVSRNLTLAAPRIVLASGAIERLPIFAGNRRPGVVGALAAFNRADRFGLWLGRRALLATATSIGYRTATAGADAGITVGRIIDTRANPQSRFIAFSKAYGLASSWNLRPRRAEPAGARGSLAVDFEAVAASGALPNERHVTDLLLVSAGWQPDLALWHMAGGDSHWASTRRRLAAEGSLPGIALAGSVAGYHTAAACLRSGEAATATLFGRRAPEIDDPDIDPVYETPDDATPIATRGTESSSKTYLDGGTSLAERPSPSPARRFWGLARRRLDLTDQPHPLGVADVAAGVELGQIPPHMAGIVAQERGVMPGDMVDAGQMHPPRAAQSGDIGTPPAYLAGRFGTATSIWRVEPADGRTFEIGCLIHPDADSADPLAAVGVVFAAAPNGLTGGIAVIGGLRAAGDSMAVRDVSGSIPVRLLDHPAEPADTPAAAPVPAPNAPEMERPLATDGALRPAAISVAGDGSA
ncbi:MAG TPA: FAD-dependent oxidoreductase [Devosiaceae bacterium]|nr:FAD-dependent oxidoreductase [Devosiaceae bacterium]